MKRIDRISLFLLAILFGGCFEDKGNYDIKDINEIVIEDFEKSYYVMTVKDTLDLKPVLTFSSGIPTNEENLSYRWFIREDRTNKIYENPAWNKKDFFWIVDIILKGNLILEIKDKRTDVIYSKQVSCNISGEYKQNGFMVLAEKGGKSILSFVKYVDLKIVNGHYEINEVKIYKDVYADNNENGVLGEGPIGIQEHFCVSASGGDVIGQFFIFQRSGGVDVNGLSYKKEVTLDQTFDGGFLPANAIFTSGAFMAVADVMASEEGRLYSRIKSRKDLFHSEYFTQEPLKFEGEVLTDCRVIRGIIRNPQYSLIYDGKYKRFLIILDGGTSYESMYKDAGKLIAVPAQQATGAPEGFVPLNNLGDYELIDIQFDRTSGYSDLGYVAILKDQGGALFEQAFILKHSKGSVVVSNGTFNRILALPATPDVICVSPYSSNEPTIYFAVGNKLYLYDRANPKDEVVLYYTFDSKITAMTNENYVSRQLAVGLEDGNFFIMDGVSAKNNTDVSKRVLYQLPENVRFDRIVDVKYKVMWGNGWEVY